MVMNTPDSAEARRQRREQFNRLAAEDLLALDQHTLEYATIDSGNPLTADKIRFRVLRAAEVFGITEFPRGYRVNGGTAKTPRYVSLAGKPATDDQLVADAMMGWLTEIAEVLEKRIASARKTHIPVETEGR